MWDAIVVGARCAGSPLARFLARAGKRVVLVDAGSFPSDQPLSTHFIQPYGMRVLEELGLAERVYEIASPVRYMIQSVDGHFVRYESQPPGACPRRIDLDQLLLEGAREAGAEVRLGQRVVDVLREGTRVVGVIAEDKDGVRTELRGAIVVGADGRHSTIADLVGAEKYFAYENTRCAYWAYWPRPSWFDEAPLDGASQLLWKGQEIWAAFPTNRDQILLGIVPLIEDLPRWKADPQARLLETLRGDPMFARIVEAEPLSKTIGIAKAEFFFRRAAGPGWALVGDAGLHKDPTPGLGISDALRDARALSRAIIEGGDVAVERYWRQRDVESWELFSFAQDMAAADYNNPLVHIALDKAQANDELRGRFVEVLNRERSPYAVFKPTEVVRWTFGALLRGRFGVLAPFFRMGKRQSEVQKELKRRRALLVPALTSGS